MNCSLIICTYNWPEALSLVLSSTLSQSIPPNEIIVADDGSDQSTAKVIEDLLKSSSIPIIHSWQKDDGYAEYLIQEIVQLPSQTYEYIIMIDGDTVLHSDFIQDHKRFAKKASLYSRKQGSLAIYKLTAMKFFNNNNEFKKPFHFLNDSKNKINMLRIPFISKLMSYFKSQNINRIRGCNYSIFKEDILDVNGFNEEITTWGREDSEFVQRLFNNGVKKQHLKFSAIQYHLVS